MDPYEKLIEEHDFIFYQSIKEYVPLMPDFRPQETIRMMRGTYVDKEFIPEPQDHWRLLYNELLALNEEEPYQILVDAINSGEELQIQPFIDRENFLSDFVFSYPAVTLKGDNALRLTWLMLKVSPENTIIPILILAEKYLDEISMKREYIKYIRSDEVTKYLVKKWLYIRSEEITKYLDKRRPSLILPEDIGSINSIGEIYWYEFLYPTSFQENKENILKRLLKIDADATLFLLRKEVFSSQTLIQVLWAVLEKESNAKNEEIILFILPRLNYEVFVGSGLWRTEETLTYLIKHSYIRALNEFLSRATFLKNPIPFGGSIKWKKNIPLLEILIKDGRFQNIF